MFNFFRNRNNKKLSGTELRKDEITIVMPAYNAEAYIAESVESIIQQNISDWTLLVLDDGSTDRTAEIVRDFSRRYSKIKLLQNGKQLGPSAQRNIGIEMATTEYLAFLDSDDMMSPNSLEDRREILNSDPFACAAYSLVRLVDPTGSPMGLNGTKGAIINFTDLVENKFITSCIFSRTQILKQLGGFDKAFKFGEDWDLWLRMTRLGYYIKSSPDSFVEYRQHGNSFSHKHIYEDFCDRMRVSERAWGRDDRVPEALEDFSYGLGSACQTMTRSKKAFLACISAIFDGNIKAAENLLELVRFDLLNLTDPEAIADGTKWTVMRNISLPMEQWNDIRKSQKDALKRFFESRSSEPQRSFVSRYIKHLTE
ncbi:MAG: hypothetical protein CMI15_11865 [Opitutaceae bacterium]|nr:hypothetical protein [Opitutaceae bacterium]